MHLFTREEIKNAKEDSCLLKYSSYRELVLFFSKLYNN